jgi:predicted O-methyltransferase YrrM
MNAKDAIRLAEVIPAWLEQNEKEMLFSLAKEVPENGHVVEVGCLYGGSTALLGLGAATAKITVFDDFSWSPLPEMVSSRETLLANLAKIELHNQIDVREGDSRTLAKGWTAPIDLLWIDGGHSYEFIFSDLMHLGPSAQVIACHDFDNPVWPSIRKAVTDFIAQHPQWMIDTVAGTLVVLRRS